MERSARLDKCRRLSPSTTISAALRDAERDLATESPDPVRQLPPWIWAADVRGAPDVQLLALSPDQVVDGLFELAGHARDEVICCTSRWVGWPPSPRTLEIAAGPSARQVVERSIMRGVDSRWFALASTPRDTFDIASTIPMDVRVIDHRILAVTERNTQTGVADRMLVTTTRSAVQAAERYIQAILTTAIPLQPNWRDPAIRPTHRQLSILRLLACDLTDERIAGQLGLSARQIRAEISTLYTMFTVQSRFSLGLAYQAWLTGHPGSEIGKHLFANVTDHDLRGGDVDSSSTAHD